MTEAQWNVFCTFRDAFKKKCGEWSKFSSELDSLQKTAASSDTPPYNIETPVVYNTALDDITKDSVIKLIVIGDNPGKSEQLAVNSKYLVGQAGKIAEGFFRRNPELKIDFRKNVIILNKTPVHSAKTAQLRLIMKDGGPAVCDLILESQLWMAEHTAELLKNLEQAELWLVGYSELKGKGFFVPYRDMLKKTICGGEKGEAWQRVFVFQHFSMNRFTIDLSAFVKQNGLDKKPLIEQLHILGELHKKEIFEE